MSQPRLHVGALLVAVAVLGVVLGASTAWPRSGGSNGRLVYMTVEDFKINAPASIRPGRLRLQLHNLGPDSHELLIAPLRAARLPLRRDGLTVDEDALEPLHPVEIEAVEEGDTEETDVDLRRGRYVLFCNMAGHYLGGMHRTLVVR
ncbi:MAG TPA: hypothetical protein VJT84_06025 [Gaiellaceae bacterium]|nr:hypothetical protein [Gaiellaceae bacterium]